jgi:putative hydrolase of the HAD superfamily
MVFQGVVFDLFGTLVYDAFSSEKYPAFLSRLATLLDLKESEFAPLWQDSYRERTLGTFPTLQDNLRWVGERLERKLDPGAVEEAANAIVDLTRRALTPRPFALETLRQIRARGLKTGLLSDCGPAVPLMWDETPFAQLFDTTVFSSREGMKKPDPRFFGLVLGRLGLTGPDCLYVGDGNGDELPGAKAMGMTPVLIASILAPDEPERWLVKDWEDVRLASLDDVIHFLDF